MLERMEESEPIANEKAITPMIIRMLTIIFSCLLKGSMSPNPTVVIIVTM